MWALVRSDGDRARGGAPGDETLPEQCETERIVGPLPPGSKGTFASIWAMRPLRIQTMSIEKRIRRIQNAWNSGRS